MRLQGYAMTIAGVVLVAAACGGGNSPSAPSEGADLEASTTLRDVEATAPERTTGPPATQTTTEAAPTPTPTTARAGATSTTAAERPGVAIVALNFDADGNDNDNKNGEWVDFRNDAAAPVDLSGWVVHDEGPNHQYRFPDGVGLDVGATVRVFTGCGDDSATQLFWCNSGSAIWNNDGDTATLLDSGGATIDEWAY